MNDSCFGCGLPAGCRCHGQLTGEWGSIPRFANGDGQFNVPVTGEPARIEHRMGQLGWATDIAVGVNRFARTSTRQLWFNSIQCAENVLFTCAYSSEIGDRCGWCGLQFEDRTFGTKKESRPLMR